MTATSHAIVGSVIAAKVGNPALAIPIALASHLVLDAIPHWDTATNGKNGTLGKKNGKVFINTLLDFAIGLIASYFLLFFLFPTTNYIYAFIIIVCAQLFDWMTVPYLFLGMNSFFYKTYKFQKIFDRKLDKPWGIITQVVTVIAVIIIGKLI